MGDREDFYTTLHAVFVKKHEHSLLFDQAFRIFWKRRGFIEKLIAMLSPRAPSKPEVKPPEAGGQSRRRRPVQIACRPRQTASADRARRPPDHVDCGDPAIEGFRADERGGDRGGPQGDQAAGDARGQASNATLRSRRPPGSDRRAPQLPPLVATGRRDRPRVPIADRSRPAGCRSLRHFRFDERIHAPAFCIFSMSWGKPGACRPFCLARV